MKGNLTVDTGVCEATTGELADGVTERYLPEVRLFHSGVPTNRGILHEAGPEEPWIIAMDCQPTQAAVRDYGTRWVIEIYQSYNLCKTLAVITGYRKAVATAWVRCAATAAA